MRGYKIQVFMTFVNMSCFKGRYLIFFPFFNKSRLLAAMYSFIAFSLFCREYISVIFSNSDHYFKEDVLRFI